MQTVHTASSQKELNIYTGRTTKMMIEESKQRVNRSESDSSDDEIKQTIETVQTCQKQAKRIPHWEEVDYLAEDETPRKLALQTAIERPMELMPRQLKITDKPVECPIKTI
jgi:hypothetical protein